MQKAYLQGQGQQTTGTGTRAGYEPTGTGAGYGTSTGTGSGYAPTGTGAGYSDYNTSGSQAGTGVPHGHNPALNQGQTYAAPSQAAGYGATTGTGVGAAGTTAQASAGNNLLFPACFLDVCGIKAFLNGLLLWLQLQIL